MALGDTEGGGWGDPGPRPYQGVDAGQGVVGVVQGVEQLVHPVVGLAVPVEADADGHAGAERGPRLEGGKHSPRRAGTWAGQGALPRAPWFWGTPGRVEPKQMGQ